MNFTQDPIYMNHLKSEVDDFPKDNLQVLFKFE